MSYSQTVVSIAAVGKVELANFDMSCQRIDLLCLSLGLGFGD